MKIQKQFKNSSLISVVNGLIVVKDASGKEYTFTNASVISVNNGTIVIELEWEPKKGELIKMEGSGTNYYAIFKTIKDSRLYDYGYTSFTKNQIIKSGLDWNLHGVNISPVTQEEQKEFDDFCKSQGIIWNKEKLQWEICKWKPKKEESYFSISITYSDIRIIESTWNNDKLDRSTYNYGNCFKTKEEAEIKLNQIKNLFEE